MPSESEIVGDHRNLLREAFEFEDYDAYLDDRLETFFDLPHLTPVDHDRDFVLDVEPLYRLGLFGKLVSRLDNEPVRSRWAELKDGDCVRCGKPDVGIYGLYDSAEGPDGEIYSIHQHTCICEECHEQALADLETYGEVQPTLASAARGGQA